MTDTTQSTTATPDTSIRTSEPPTGTGPLLKREARLAWGLLFPTIAIVSAVVILPLLAIFWISVKPVQLSDLRAPELVLREDLRRVFRCFGDANLIVFQVAFDDQSVAQSEGGGAFHNNGGYDLSSLHIENNGHDSSNVYKFISRRLRRRGWTKHQYSCWRRNGLSVHQAHATTAHFIGSQAEAQYGDGVFIRLEYQRHLQFVSVR